mmetsp:Transcript_20345/g.38018  ORF Transcript_20345/g.38018 Transcript_20345/m.38018 type:complete len:446 (-) Transcript_20345:33-1370(-)
MNALRLLGMILIIFIICGVLVRSSINTAYQPTSLHSIYMKIFANYLQLVLLTTQLELQWPGFVYSLFNVQRSAGTATDQFLSVDCYLANEGDDKAYINIYFDKLKLVSLIPLIFSFVASAYWSLHYLTYRNGEVFRKQYVATVVILFFMIHPNILRSNFAFFSCSEIEPEEYWLNENLDIRCFDDTHKENALTVVLPSLLLWGVFTPFIILIHLLRKQHYMGDILMKLRFGFLYNGFKKSKFYWEFVIMYRKILVICCVVFIGNRLIPIQALTVILLLLNFLIVQYLTRPYANSQLNEMELRAIMTATVTIYCGLFYLTNDLDATSKVVFFVIMLASNAYFLYYFIMQLGLALSEKFANVHPIIRQVFRLPPPNFYPEAKTYSEPTSVKTSVVADETQCSLFKIPSKSKAKVIKTGQLKEIYISAIMNNLQTNIRWEVQECSRQN